MQTQSCRLQLQRVAKRQRRPSGGRSTVPHSSAFLSSKLSGTSTPLCDGNAITAELGAGVWMAKWALKDLFKDPLGRIETSVARPTARGRGDCLDGQKGGNICNVKRC